MDQKNGNETKNPNPILFHGCLTFWRISILEPFLDLIGPLRLDALQRFGKIQLPLFSHLCTLIVILQILINSDQFQVIVRDLNF